MCIYSKHVTIGGNNIKHKKYTLEVDVIGYKVVSDIRISEIPAISKGFSCHNIPEVLLLS